MKKINVLLGILLFISLIGCASIKTIEDLPQRDYVALGNSVTAGVGANGVVDLKDPLASIDRRKAYPYLVAKSLGIKYMNIAVPGAMSDDVLKLQVIPALALRPKIITIWCGGNDLVHGRTVDDYSSDLRSILSALDKSDADIYVLNLPDVWKAGKFIEKPDDDVTEKRVAAFNEATKLLVIAHSDTLVDISGSELVDPLMLADDGFHVGEAGNKWISVKLIAAIHGRQ